MKLSFRGGGMPRFRPRASRGAADRPPPGLYCRPGPSRLTSPGILMTIARMIAGGVIFVIALPDQPCYNTPIDKGKKSDMSCVGRRIWESLQGGKPERRSDRDVLPSGCLPGSSDRSGGEAGEQAHVQKRRGRRHCHSFSFRMREFRAFHGVCCVSGSYNRLCRPR